MLMEMQRHQVNGTALEKSIGQRQDRTADAGLFRAAQSVMTCVSPASPAGQAGVVGERRALQLEL